MFIEWLTQPGDVVYDPFSGRGTAPFEACRLGRIGLGSDANPLAYVLTAAKVDPPTHEAVVQRLEALASSQPSRRAEPVPDAIRMLYSAKVLRQLCWLRRELDLSDRTDRFILATVLGIMHANYTPGRPARGLSISMPNTFSMAPRYVRGFIDEHCLKPPNVDVFDMVARKVDRLALPPAACSRGRAWLGDARVAAPLPEGPARLVFTSPPYLSVIRYGKYNWIRLWMLGHEPRQVDEALVATSSLPRYLSFVGEVLSGLEHTVRRDGYACLMIGDVTDSSAGTTVNLAETVWREVAHLSGWRLLGTVADHLPEQHKVSRIWGHSRGEATKVDRILILAPPGTTHRLPPRPRRVRWDASTDWTDLARGDA